MHSWLQETVCPAEERRYTAFRKSVERKVVSILQGFFGRSIAARFNYASQVKLSLFRVLEHIIEDAEIRAFGFIGHLTQVLNRDQIFDPLTVLKGY